jgi:hypothetical protein
LYSIDLNPLIVTQVVDGGNFDIWTNKGCNCLRKVYIHSFLNRVPHEGLWSVSGIGRRIFSNTFIHMTHLGRAEEPEFSIFGAGAIFLQY